MKIPADIQKRVHDKLVEGIALLEAKYNQKFKMPTITYNMSARAAGRAFYSKWLVEFSAPYLLDPANVDEMINVTVPHELAHLAAFKLFPEDMERTELVGNRIMFKKREVHGYNWKCIMRVLKADSERCHDMQLSSDAPLTANTRQRATFPWICTGCAKIVQLGPKHNKSQEMYGAVYHRSCGRIFKLIKPEQSTTVTIPPVQPKPVVPSAPVKGAPLLSPSMTKIEKCKSIYQANRGVSRATMIQMFINRADCTAAGASTYHHTCSKLFG